MFPRLVVCLILAVLTIPALHAAEAPPPKSAPAPPAAAARPLISGLIVEPATVTSRHIADWKGNGLSAICLVLDESHAPESYATAARAAAAGSMPLYYWIEIARNPALAAEHPRWMASLGVHNDWQRRFPAMRPLEKGEVAKAYPWVPINYREAYDAHLARVRELLTKRAASPYTGLLLNDLQGGPASCGCGNLQCRWATDYHVPSTATRIEADDIAAQFTADVRKLAQEKLVVPVWTSECEDIDLPGRLAPGGKSTGLSGDVACANATCPKVFTKQLAPLLTADQGPLGLLALQQELERDAAHGHPQSFAPRALNYLDTIPPKNGGPTIPHERVWLIIQGHGLSQEEQSAIREAALKLGASGLFQSLVPIEQSFEPRAIISAK
jgi:hypothetical protein